MSTAQITAAVDDYTSAIGAMYAMDTSHSGFTPWCMTTARHERSTTIVDRLASPMMWLGRQDTCKGAHRLVAVVSARHWDYWEHAIGRAITTHCARPPRNYMELDIEVDARNLGKAIGPRGATVQRAHKEAKFYWDAQRPSSGMYTLWVPRSADVRQARDAFRGVLS